MPPALHRGLILFCMRGQMMDRFEYLQNCIDSDAMRLAEISSMLFRGGAARSL
eukprot:EC713732.1.p1 GENE.EC713732.1~~EC713732.1.p1  ORF type:complete len:53 (+),score=9.13 EC713732.1:3-161(+)